MNIKEIEIVLGNCEVIKIPGNNIGWIDISSIHHRVYRAAINYIQSINIADNVELELLPDTNDKAVKRLSSCNDIVWLEIEYDDNNREIYYVDYDGNEVNNNQSTYLSDAGNLFIVIGKGMTIENSFHDYICDKNEMIKRNELFRNMYKIHKDS